LAKHHTWQKAQLGSEQSDSTACKLNLHAKLPDEVIHKIPNGAQFKNKNTYHQKNQEFKSYWGKSHQYPVTK
jgi:hypothetical protein